MKKIVILICLLLFAGSAYCQDKTSAILFYSPHCKACLEVKANFLPQIKEKYKDSLEWRELNTYDNADNLSLLLSLTIQFNKKESVVPAVFVGDSFLMGKNEVEEKLDEAIEEAVKKKTRMPTLFKINLSEVFGKLSVLTVMGSGLIDGINPCAFAVIVFFISFLAVYGYKKKEIVYVGTFYCLAVFITYLLIGLGFFKFFYSLRNIYFLIKFFYYLVAFFCFLMAGLALWDYFKLKNKGTNTDMILQLPKFLKKKINVVIGSHLRHRKDRGALRLIISSLVVGFLVSLLEAVCTGQIYIPTIVFILKNTDLRLKAATYLVLYNLMFILPLILVFLLSLLGVSSVKFNDFLKRNLGVLKIVMVFVFVVLGIFILWIS